MAHANGAWNQARAMREDDHVSTYAGRRPTPVIPSSAYARANAPSPSIARHSATTHGNALVGWLIVFVFLNVGDLLSTYLGLQVGLREANPLMGTLLGVQGFGALIAYKALAVLIVLMGMFFLRNVHQRAAGITLFTCNALIFLAIALNVTQMLALG